MGISVSGGGFGGLALSPLIRFLITQVGWRWTLRIMGIAAFALLLGSAALLRMRVHAKRTSKIDFSYFRDSSFVRLFVMALMMSLSWFVPFFYIPLYSTQQGLSKEQGALLAGLLNAASATGRVSLGFVADYAGATNTLVSCLFLATVLVFVMWPFSVTFGGILAFVLLFGVFLGGFASLVPTAVAHLFGSRGNLATVTGMIFTGYVGNLVGAPIAGAIIDHYTTYSTDGSKSINFLPAIIYTGGFFTLSLLACVSVRMSAAKNRLFVKI
nr:hypothetical protein HK105_003897 [Polyrhizophydium stewartii]